MISNSKPEIGRPFLEQMEQLGILQKRFSGDASLIETCPPCPLLLDTGDFFSELGRADRSDIAGWAAADNHQIVFHKK